MFMFDKHLICYKEMGQHAIQYSGAPVQYSTLLYQHPNEMKLTKNSVLYDTVPYIRFQFDREYFLINFYDFLFSTAI